MGKSQNKGRYIGTIASETGFTTLATLTGFHWWVYDSAIGFPGYHPWQINHPLRDMPFASRPNSWGETLSLGGGSKPSYGLFLIFPMSSSTFCRSHNPSFRTFTPSPQDFL